MALEGIKGFFSNHKTFRPSKKYATETLRFKLHRQAEASLEAGIDLREAIKKPQNEKLDDWIAVHVVDFFNRTNLIYGIVCDNCTLQTCPKMSGGNRYEYHWKDNDQYKKPTPLPAPVYIDLLMGWIEDQICDSRIFPNNYDEQFPKNYREIVKKIFSRLYRVFVHVYIHHFESLVLLGAEAHVNTCYRHFYYFVNAYELIDRKELEPLAELNKKLCP